MRSALRGVFSSIVRMCLAGAWVAVWCGAALATGDLRGQDKPSESSAEEPQALLAPVELLPVTPQRAAPATAPAMERTGPAVKLAPELNTLMGSRKEGDAVAAADIKPANFKDVTPGETTRDEVIEKLGEPAHSATEDGAEVLTYALGPFPKVRITLHKQIVDSVVIHLASPSARAEVAQELGLADLHAVLVSDDQRRPLGEVYPERGLMFAYADGATDAEAASVEHVILERVSFEPFLLRAQQAPADHYAERLADLATAQRMAPDNPAAFGMAARLELECGRPKVALAAAEKAVQLDADSAEYQLTLADARRQLGQSREALEATRNVLQQSDLSPQDQARARYLLGRLLATTAPRNYRQAMDETVAAIKVAAGQLNGADIEDRIQMRRILIDAELSLAEILAYGPWKQKHEVIPQWLVTAEKAANEYVTKDGGPRSVLLSVYRTSLHCLLVLDGQGAPDNIADAAIQLGQDLVAQVDDDDQRAAIEWQLGTGLWYAAQVALRQGHASAALEYANNADALLTSGGKQRSESPETAHHLAQLHFLTGSIYAIDRNDDATAVKWFDRALPKLQTPYPGSLQDERGVVGEQLVSVGISLWHTGRRNTAVSVTEEGTNLLAQAVQEGGVKKSTLAIPYQNLAEMHRQLGNTDKADRLASKAVEADPESGKEVKRR